MNWKSFWQGLAAAAIGGAATSSTHYLTGGNTDLTHLGPIAAIGAIIGVAGLFTQSPTAPPPTSQPPQNNTTQFPQTK